MPSRKPRYALDMVGVLVGYQQRINIPRMLTETVQPFFNSFECKTAIHH
jgi:hypothetical protein